MTIAYVCPQVNCVVMRGLNDDELCDFVELTKEKVGSYIIALLSFVVMAALFSIVD